MSSDALIPVLITAIGGGGHGEQILKALRCAPAGRYRIFGADANAHCPQFCLVEQAFVLPRANDPAFLDAVLSMCRRFGVKALFHGCEPELKVYAENRDAIESEGIFVPINPLSVINTCMDKLKTAAFLQDNGFAPPRYARVNAPEDIEKIDWFPVVVKPSVGGGGSANCFIAQSNAEILALLAYLGGSVNTGPMMVQEYVGRPDHEYTVGVLHDLDGNFLNSIAVRRHLNGTMNIRSSVPNRSGRPELGSSLVVSSGVSQGEVGAFPEVTGPCERLAKSLGVRGAVNVQCRLVGDEVKVFEINPRFSGTTSIRAMMGYNEPDVLLRKHLLNEDIPVRFPYRSGVVLRGLMEFEECEQSALKWDEIPQ
jgi:carbamoyl-phosphate synthase large subunit